MSKGTGFITATLMRGLLVVVPVYLAVLLLLKGMQTVGKLVRPMASLLPAWLPAEGLLSLLLVLLIVFVIGLAVKTRNGHAFRERMERTFFERLPGYALLRGLTQQIAGSRQGEAWTPVLAEIEDALVPAFIIEEHDDGRYTIFVPSVPTPLAGAVYVLARDRVHILDVPFTHAIRVISRWGSGSKELVAAMPKKRPAA